MLQRALDGKDPASGKFEFPGGHIEPGEDSLDAAQREWSEEVGLPLPAGNVAGSWTSPNGVYRGHVHVAPSEAEVAINPDRPKVRNPDNPRGKYCETAVWMDPDHISENPAVRDEVKSSASTWLPVVKAAQSADGMRSEDLDVLADELLAAVQ
jgi:8-oxo-dGTP pyrophosphatase MutT (NUDIX family)